MLGEKYFADVGRFGLRRLDRISLTCETNTDEPLFAGRLSADDAKRIKLAVDLDVLEFDAYPTRRAINVVLTSWTRGDVEPDRAGHAVAELTLASRTARRLGGGRTDLGGRTSHSSPRP